MASHSYCPMASHSYCPNGNSKYANDNIYQLTSWPSQYRVSTMGSCPCWSSTSAESRQCKRCQLFLLMMAQTNGLEDNRPSADCQLAGHLAQLKLQRADELHGLGGLPSTHDGEIFASHCIRLPGNCGVLSIGLLSPVFVGGTAALALHLVRCCAASRLMTHPHIATA